MALGILVQKWLGGAGNLMSNGGTGSQRLACRLENGLEGQVICWVLIGLDQSAWLRTSVLKWLGGTGKYHRNWCVGFKMAWRGRLGKLNRSGGTDGERLVQSDRWLRVGVRNRSATIGSWGAVGGNARFLSTTALVIQGRGLFVSEQQTNTNRLHTNRN